MRLGAKNGIKQVRLEAIVTEVSHSETYHAGQQDLVQRVAAEVDPAKAYQKDEASHQNMD